MLPENFSVLKTFKATVATQEFKVEQLKGDKNRQDIRYKLTDSVFPNGVVLPAESYWQLNPVEIKG